MVNVMNKIIKKMSTGVLGVIIAIGTSMLLISWVHVFYRYVLNSSLTWSEELLKILLVWFCMLSMTVISVKREHVSIVVFKEHMPKKVEKALTMLSQVLMVVASGIIFCIGIMMFVKAGVRVTTAMRLPFRWVYAAVPVSFGIMTFYELRNLLEDMKNAKVENK